MSIEAKNIINNPKIITILCLLLFWIWPVPQGLTQQTWHLFGILVTTIVAFSLKPLPMSCCALLSLTIVSVTNTLTIKQALDSFDSTITWLVICAFILAKGFIKTGLGTRIAYYLIKLLGKNMFGLAYGLIGTEIMLAPFIPSNTARGAGIIYPIASAVSAEYEKISSSKEIFLGSYLTQICFHSNVITSTMFLTAMAGNPIIASIVAPAPFNLTITWSSWFKAAIIPSLISVVLLPFILKFLLKTPHINTTKIQKFATTQLHSMGKVSPKELIMIFTFILLIILWVFGQYLNIDATTAALCGLSCLIVTNVITIDDILNEHHAWNTFIWLGTLLTFTTYLAEFGFMNWLGGKLNTWISVLNWKIALCFIFIIYFYSHYLFASIVSRISTMYSTFIVLLTLIGAPLNIYAYVLGFFSSVSACLTHYGTASAPIYFSSNYFTIRQWWKLGFAMSFIYFLIWGVIASIVLYFINL